MSVVGCCQCSSDSGCESRRLALCQLSAYTMCLHDHIVGVLHCTLHALCLHYTLFLPSVFALPVYNHILMCTTTFTQALEGQDQRSPAYHSLVLELLQEADRSAHKPQPRLVFMCCLARLVPRLGLYTVRHLAALMPLLLEWVHAYDKDSSVVALQLLGLLVQYTWPRMSVHVDVVRQHVQQALAQERVERGHWGVVVEEQQQRQQEEQGDEAGAAVDSRRYAAGAELLALLDSVAAVPPIAAS